MWFGALERGGRGAGVDVVGFLEWGVRSVGGGKGDVFRPIFMYSFLCALYNLCCGMEII